MACTMCCHILPANLLSLTRKWRWRTKTGEACAIAALRLLFVPRLPCCLPGLACILLYQYCML